MSTIKKYCQVEWSYGNDETCIQFLEHYRNKKEEGIKVNKDIRLTYEETKQLKEALKKSISFNN
jgi:hypothetical protein